MAKSKSKSKSQTTSSFAFPSLHKRVVDAISGEIGSLWFNKNGDSASSMNEYQTHVMGKFKCSNKSCSKNGWSSKKVAIQIRGYRGNGYHAEVFNQRCKSCDELGLFTLDEDSYVERVTYRLKKWAGVRMETSYRGGGSGPPHERRFCEGCKRGVCQGDPYDLYD